ncbi:unnamed protein product [Adineta ricciae]|nr:unnamed protein product [Adineta ricciae]
MIVTYALTMTALQQAHTTKRERTKRRKKIRAVVNLAAMAVKWKRAVNAVEIPDDKPSLSTTNSNHGSVAVEKELPVNYQRKRSSSLLMAEQPKKSIFISHQRLDEYPQRAPSLRIHMRREKSPDQMSNQHLNVSTPNNLQTPTRRSHSCTPFLDAKNARKNRRRSSSVHTLLQIRRNSAKISEELANLTAQLSASASNADPSSKRASLSVPAPYDRTDKETPTIAQLLAEASVNQPIVIPTSFLTVNPKRRRRSNSADIRLPIFDTNERKTSTSNLPVPNLLVTHDSPHTSLSNDHSECKKHHSTIDVTCQRIKDWIITTASSTTLNNLHQTQIPLRCASAINITENTPILNGPKQNFPPLTRLKKHFPRIEQLYGQTSTPNTTFQPQQHLLVDDHVPSVQHFAVGKRASIYSLTSSILASRSSRYNRPSTSSSLGSSSLQGTIRRAHPRLKDIVSQVSFQMVSLDTDDTSSCTSSLTYHSAQLQSAIAGTANTITNRQRKKRQRFKSSVKKCATNERKAMRVLLIIFSIFVILWTPFFVINLISCFVSDIHPLLAAVATWLGYCSSCANPIIYTIFSRTFRQTFVNILTCRKTIHPRPSSQMFSPSAGHSMTMSAGRKFSAISKGHTDLR